MEEPENRVWVSATELSDAIRAQSQPTFIVKVGDVYFLTQAVWEYDRNTPGITDDQTRACDDVKLRFDGTTPKLEAVQVPFPMPAGGFSGFGNQTK